MKKTNYIFWIVCIAILTSLTSCEKKSSGKVQAIYNSTQTPIQGNVTRYSTEEIRTNTTVSGGDDYKYEHRTGTSGNYQYNYDVSGDGVEGNVDMQGRYGSGTITDENGNEKDVDVEWVGYGEMEATDNDGNTYSLEAD